MALADDLVQAAAESLYQADDHDYGDYEQALQLDREKPHLENDYPRYEGMTRATLAKALRWLDERGCHVIDVYRDPESDSTEKRTISVRALADAVERGEHP